jgi:hypothetical protein
MKTGYNNFNQSNMGGGYDRSMRNTVARPNSSGPKGDSKKEKRVIDENLRGKPVRDKTTGKKTNIFRDVCASFQRMGLDMRGTRKTIKSSSETDRRKELITDVAFMNIITNRVKDYEYT